MRRGRKPLLALTALILFGSVLFAGADETRPDLRIHVTRDLRGWLEPCDCKAGVLGGFPRRASVIADRRPDLLLEAGASSSRLRPTTS